MKQGRYRLIEKEALTASRKMWRMRFEAPDIEAEPGQFVEIEAEGHYLRRPISVSEYEKGVLTLIIQEAGKGSRQIIETSPGESLDMLTGLGNRFSLPGDDNGADVILAGGGVGYAPLVGLMKRLTREKRCKPTAVFGFNGGADVPLGHLEELRREGMRIEWATMSGEEGWRGNSIETALSLMERENLRPEYFYACGPWPMMKGACKAFDFEGELSLEARMGCGFGACMGCTILTADGPKRICKEGPVFKKSKLVDIL